MAEYRIRPATVDDIPALEELIEHSVRTLAIHNYMPDEIDGAIGRVLGLDTQLIDDRTYFVAELAAGPPLLVGCGGWSYRATLYGSDNAPNRQPATLDPATDAAKIRAIFVHPDWSRRGLGSMILKHCEDAAARAGFRRLEMGSTLTGVALYALRGYEPRERVDVPLSNGAVLGVLHMTKTL